VKKINIVVIGHAPPAEVEHYRRFIEKAFRYPVEVYARVAYPEKCYVPERGQYDAACVLAKLFEYPGFRVLGIIDVDIFVEGTNFVFGLAARNEQCALVSTYRLRNAQHLFFERMKKEIMHELGHTFGLLHCENECVMRFSNTVFDTDNKPAEFCQACRDKIHEHLR